MRKIKQEEREAQREKRPVSRKFMDRLNDEMKLARAGVGQAIAALEACKRCPPLGQVWG